MDLSSDDLHEMVFVRQYSMYMSLQVILFYLNDCTYGKLNFRYNISVIRSADRFNFQLLKHNLGDCASGGRWSRCHNTSIRFQTSERQ